MVAGDDSAGPGREGRCFRRGPFCEEKVGRNSFCFGALSFRPTLRFARFLPFSQCVIENQRMNRF